MDNQTVSIRDVLVKLGLYYRFLLSKWKIILTVGLLGGIIGLACSLLIKPKYIASTTFVLEEEKVGGAGLSSLAGIASVAGLDLGLGSGGGIFQGDNIFELYRSRKMIEQALLTRVPIDSQKVLLIDRYLNYNQLREKWDDKALKNIQFQEADLLSGERNFSRLQDSILGKIVEDINEKHLQISKPDKKLTIIRVEVKSKDEYFAAAFNKAIVNNVNEFYIETKTKKIQQNVNILQRKTDSVRAAMNGEIYSAAAVNDATPNLNPTRQIRRMAPIQRSQFSMEINKAMLAELIKNLELSKITLVKETPLIQVIDEPLFPLHKERLGKAKGIVLGGIIAGLLIVMILTARMLIVKIMKT